MAPILNSLLIVDDDPVTRESMIQMLSMCGFSAFPAHNGQSALKTIHDNCPDLVLLNTEIPDISGIDVLTTLREKYTRTQLPIIMVTVETESSDAVSALAAGANDCVAKSGDFSVLLARIQTHLSRKHVESALHKSEERYALAALVANDGLWDWDLTVNEISFSSRWKSMLGWDTSEISDNPNEWFDRIHPEDADRVRADIDAHLNGQVPHFECEYRVLHRDGNYLWVLGRGLAVRDESGNAYRMSGSQTDVTGTKVVDVMTALPKGVLFMDRLGRAFERVKRQKDKTLALISLDLHSFRTTSGSFTNLTSNQLLVAIARRLATKLRKSDSISRVEGNSSNERIPGIEFTILLEDISSALNATRVARRILDDFARPFVVGSQKVFSTANIGIAIYSPHYQDHEELLRDATTAMIRARDSDKYRYEIFDSKIRADVFAHLKLENELRHANERKEFENNYQAIVSLGTGKICGFETLVRWNNPVRGLTQPNKFIPVAEETGLIVPMSWSILETACQQIHNWQACFEHDPKLFISVNLSSRCLFQFDLLQRCSTILSEADLDSCSLNIEVAESILMPNPGPAIDLMHKIKDLGIKIILDDFGTGCSSLSYIHQCPLDSIKIDCSLIANIQQDDEIVRTILTMGRNLGIQVIAEGVETMEQVKILQVLGCEFAQGYYFSHPIKAQEATDLLATKRHWSASSQAELRRKFSLVENPVQDTSNTA